MKAGIHPDYVNVNVHCACGATWTTRSTKGQELRLVGVDVGVSWVSDGVEDMRVSLG